MAKNNNKHPMTLERLTLHSERFDTKETKAGKEKEERQGPRYVVDGVALFIREEARGTRHIFHVKLGKDIILKCRVVHWESFDSHSYAQIR